MPKSTKTQPKKADQYDEGGYNYLKYWDGRDYEHASEEMAIKRLLKGKHFNAATDIGGGYGRLCIFLENFADKVTLAEPSKQQLEIARTGKSDGKNVCNSITLESLLLPACCLRFLAISFVTV